MTNRQKSEINQLRLVLLKALARVIDLVDVEPGLLAREALVDLDPNNTTPPQVYIAASLELRQLARGICREKFEQSEEQRLIRSFLIFKNAIPSPKDPMKSRSIDCWSS